MATQKLGIEAVLDDKDFTKGLSNYTSALDKAKTHTSSVASALTNSLKGAGTAVVNLGAMAAKLTFAAAVAGATALAGALSFSVKAAMEAQVIDAQLDAVLKSTAGAAGMSKEAITGLATELGGLTMFEDDAIVSAENMLLTFTNIGSTVFPQATETVLNMSQALGQDLTSSAMQLGKALNDPIAGIAALQRVGVKFTDGQKESIKAMVEMGDVAGAQKIILKELETEFGNSAKAAGQTLPGQLTILKNTLGNVAETIGGALLPALTGLATMINTQLASPETQALISGLATSFGLLFKGDLPGAIATFSGALSNVFGTEKGLQIYQFLNGIRDTATGAFGAIKTWTDTNGPKIMDGLTTAFTFFNVNIAPPLKKGFDDIVTAAGNLWTWATTNGPKIWAGLKPLWDTFKTDTLAPLGDSLFLMGLKLKDIYFWATIYGPLTEKNLRTTFTNMQAFTTTLKDEVLKLGPAFDAIKAWIDTNTPLVETAWTGLMNNMFKDTNATTSASSPTGIPFLFATMWGGLQRDAAITLGDLATIIHVGLLVVNGKWAEAWTAIQEGQTKHNYAVNENTRINNGIYEKVIGEGVLGVQTALDKGWTTRMQTDAQNWQDFNICVDTGMTNNKALFGPFLSDVQTQLDTGYTARETGEAKGWVEFGKETTKGSGANEIILSTYTGNATKIFTDVNLKPAGVSMIQGFMDGAGSMGGALAAAAGSLAQQAVQAILNALNSHSPSKVMMDVGVNFSVGMAEGILDAANIVAAAGASLSKIAIGSAMAGVTGQRVSAPASTVYNYVTNNNGNTYQLNASYRNSQSEGSLRDTVRLLQVGG